MLHANVISTITTGRHIFAGNREPIAFLGSWLQRISKSLKLGHLDHFLPQMKAATLLIGQRAIPKYMKRNKDMAFVH